MGFLVFIILSALKVTLAALPPAELTAQKLSLQEAIGLALKNNHDVLKSIDVLEASRAQLGSARSQFFPKVELEVEGGAYHDRATQPGDTSVPVVARDRNAYLAQLIVSQSIFSGFQNSSATSRYAAQTTRAELDLEIAKEEAIEETIRLYFGVQLSEKEIQSEMEVQAFREDELKEVEHRMEKGRATDFHQLQALYEVKKILPRIELLKTELSLKRLTLYRRLNLPLDGIYTLTDSLPEKGSFPLNFKLPSLGEALEFALQHNLRLRRLESELQALQAQSGESLAKHLPSLNLDLSAGSNAYQKYDIASPDSMTYGAQLSLKIPLFSGLDSISDRKFWNSRLEECRQEGAKIRENILSDFNDTYRRLEMSKKRIEASEVNIELTDRAVRRAQNLYKVGNLTLPEVLNAYSSSLEAKKQSLQDEYDRIISFFHLKSILGLGAKFDGESDKLLGG